MRARAELMARSTDRHRTRLRALVKVKATMSSVRATERNRFGESVWTKGRGRSSFGASVGYPSKC